MRSQTKVTAPILQAGTRLRVVGRAGVGVDNVDIETATRRGVIVMNTPGGNTISTAEHAFSLLLSVARKIPQAHANLQSGQWDRKQFEGTELYNKTLGIIGMGRIGSELSRRAIAFGMRVLAYDPYLSTSRARSLQVELIEELDELLPPGRLSHAAHAAHLRDTSSAQCCAPNENKTRCAADQLRARRADRRDALVEALASGQVGGRGARCFRKGAACRPIRRCAGFRT